MECVWRECSKDCKPCDEETKNVSLTTELSWARTRSMRILQVNPSNNNRKRRINEHNASGELLYSVWYNNNQMHVIKIPLSIFWAAISFSCAIVHVENTLRRFYSSMAIARIPHFSSIYSIFNTIKIHAHIHSAIVLITKGASISQSFWLENRIIESHNTLCIFTYTF